MARSKGTAAAILARFLDRFGTPPSNRMESDLERVWKRLRIENADLTESVVQAPIATQPGARSHLRILGAAAAILLVLTTTLILRHGRDAAHTVIDTGGASLVRAADAKTLQAGDRIENGDMVQSTGRSAVLRTADGSRIEMRARSILSLEPASDGVRILLNRGSVIVTAAKQHDGHLYVKTREVTVSVVGTVFLVNAEETGSRVAVIQGEVHVQRGPEMRKLLPGDQIATARSMTPLPVAEEISWSSDLAAHVALLQQSVGQATAGTRKFAKVSGSVANALDGQALGEVTVTLRDSETDILSTRISSEDGSFAFSELRPGTYQVDWHRPGFTRGGDLPKLIVREGQDLNDVLLKLAPSAQQRVVEFEVATVKPSNLPGGLYLRSCRGKDTKLDPRPNRPVTPLGRCVFQHEKLVTLIAAAYEEELRQFKQFAPFELVTGGPTWKTLDNWYIEGKAPDPSTVTERELYRMLQNLLVERFKLRFHRESKEITGYALVVAKGGPRLTPAKDKNVPSSAIIDPLLPPGLESINTRNRSMFGLALSLSGLGLGHVIDKTQLEGTYDFVLTFARDFDMSLPRNKNGEPVVVQPGAGPSVFTALEQQLGLRLEPAKLKFEFLVLDSAERPHD